jgi:hypothetical protein
VKLETAPTYREIEFILQPDQAGLLRDEAERSDEVGIEREIGHRSTCII